MRNSKTTHFILKSSAYLTLSILALIICFVVFKSWPFIQQVGLTHLWQDNSWHPTEQQFNVLPMLITSLLIMFGSVVLAAPIGVLLAIFMRFYAPQSIASLYRLLVELLAGIPSVVYGFWGLIVLVPLIARWAPPGASVLAACLVLALMILPLIVLITDTALSGTPKKWLAAADALNLSRWARIYKIILPNALPSILSGVILQAGRALGETMAVLMVCGNIVQLPTSLFDPARTLTANIALEMSYASEQHSSALFVSGLVLLLITIVIVILAHRYKPNHV